MQFIVTYNITMTYNALSCMVIIIWFDHFTDVNYQVIEGLRAKLSTLT